MIVNCDRDLNFRAIAFIGNFGHGQESLIQAKKVPIVIRLRRVIRPMVGIIGKVSVSNLRVIVIVEDLRADEVDLVLETIGHKLSL